MDLAIGLGNVQESNGGMESTALILSKFCFSGETREVTPCQYNAPRHKGIAMQSIICPSTLIAQILFPYFSTQPFKLQ